MNTNDYNDTIDMFLDWIINGDDIQESDKNIIVKQTNEIKEIGLNESELDIMVSKLLKMVSTEKRPDKSELMKSGNNSKMRLTGLNNGIAQCNVRTFDLLAGYTCPAASLCKAYAVESKYTNNISGRVLKKTNRTEFVCFAARNETQYNNTYNLHKRNLQIVNANRTDIIRLAFIIYHSVIARKNTKIVRIHYSGDFYHINYYIAWLIVARALPNISFFGYTKILPYITEFKAMWSKNIRIAYSYGSIYDKIRDKFYPDTITAYVILSREDSDGLPIACYNPHDTSDYNHIVEYTSSFCLVIH